MNRLALARITAANRIRQNNLVRMIGNQKIRKIILSQSFCQTNSNIFLLAPALPKPPNLATKRHQTDVEALRRICRATQPRWRSFAEFAGRLKLGGGSSQILQGDSKLGGDPSQNLRSDSNSVEVLRRICEATQTRWRPFAEFARRLKLGGAPSQNLQGDSNSVEALRRICKATQTRWKGATPARTHPHLGQ